MNCIPTCTSLLLLTDTDSLAPSSSRLGMLSTHTQRLKSTRAVKAVDTNECRTPLWARIFFNRSRSSRSLLSRALASNWEYFPSTISFCLLRNQSGILYCVGFWMIVTIRSSSSVESSPALRHVSPSHFDLEPFVKIYVRLELALRVGRGEGPS
jgi:hypothetical protein